MIENLAVAVIKISKESDKIEPEMKMIKHWLYRIIMRHYRDYYQYRNNYLEKEYYPLKGIIKELIYLNDSQSLLPEIKMEIQEVLEELVQGLPTGDPFRQLLADER